MVANKINLAIFDFDGTLCSGHLWVGIAKHHWKHKVKRLRLVIYLMEHLPFWVAAKLKIYNEEKNRAQWGKDLPFLIKGYTREEVQKVMLWVTDNYFMPLLRPDMLKVLNEHHTSGHKVMLLSGMFEEILEVLGQRIGADYVVGTKLEMVHTLFSGKIIEPLCFGENKAKYLTDFIRLKQMNVDLRECTAYADSVYDAAVFRIVGNPVAVYPDKALIQLARREKWQIIDR